MQAITTGLIALLIAVASAVPASAHRLDEYLQALRVDVRADGIVLELDLTPGTGLAADVLGTLDPNADGVIDSSEADSYVAGVMRSLATSVDDRLVALDLVSRTIPSTDAVRAGRGVINLVAKVEVRQSQGPHRLRMSNGYRPDVSAYLANALRPDSRAITIAAQSRDPRQQTLTIDYVVDATPVARASVWAAIAVVLLGCSAYWRVSPAWSPWSELKH
jgi:hypothetical protein